jgi:hypothetical protein
MSAHVDGNALAGPLSEMFSVDVTGAVGTCAGCGDTSVLAEARVFPDPMGFVVRCSHCEDVLMTVVTAPDHAMVELSGLSRLVLTA